MTYKICYFLDYGESFGGAVNTLLQQAILMKESGHEVIIFKSDYHGNQIEEGYKKIYEKLNLDKRFLTYQICSHTEDIDVVCIQNNYQKVKEVLKKINPDLLHSVQINPLVELVSRELKIPHIMNIYQLLPEFFSFDYLDIFPKYHICDSMYFAEKWNQYLDTDYACIRTVANSKENIKNQFTNQKEIIFLCVGSICTRKNQENVIRGFHKALGQGLKGKLYLYGYCNTPYAEKCKNYVKKNHLTDSILFQGFCENMEQAYENADVLLCGSTSESYPNAISEALSQGLIILSTPVAGVPEIIRDGDNGYITTDYSVEAIFDKIMELNNDRNSGKIDKILVNARETFQQVHTPKVIQKELVSYYRKVLDNFKSKKVELFQFEDLIYEFKDMVKEYIHQKDFFSDKQFVESKLWYIHHLKSYFKKNLCDPDCKFYIWGTGKFAKFTTEIIEAFLEDVSIEGYIDTYKTGTFLDKEISSPSKIISNKKNIIFIGIINGQLEVLEELKNQGRKCNEDHFIIARRCW